MNKKFKKITAILMSALIISSVATLTACTDASTNDKSKATEASTEGITTLYSEEDDGIYVQGVFPEDATLYAHFNNGYIESTIPLVISQYWYRSWFGVNNETPKFVQREFSVEVYSEVDEYFPLDMKVFVPYDKSDCHIVYYDHEYNLKEIPSEYINGEYVFFMSQPDFKHGGDIYNFYIYTYGEPAEPNAKPIQQTLTDEETGITVSGEIPPDTQLMVFDYSNNHTLGSDKVTTPELYYIALVRGYKEIISSTPLTVTIPGKNDKK